MPSLTPTDVANVVRACRDILRDADTVEIDAEYFYASLPLCVIDSVFAIGVRYEGVRNVFDRYCRVYGLPKQSPMRAAPPRTQQESITGFMVRLMPMGADRLAA